MEKALIYKPIKRKLEREKRKLNGKNNLCIIEKLNGDIVNIKRKSLKKNLMSQSKNKLRICIDCSFENLMGFSDIRHLGKQLGFCYGSNRRMESPLQVFFLNLFAFERYPLLHNLEFKKIPEVPIFFLGTKSP